MTMQWLMGWWNLIFLAPFFVALLYLGVYTLTGIGSGDSEATGHGDGGHGDGDSAEADADADADDGGSDLHMGTGAGGGHGGDSAHPHGERGGEGKAAPTSGQGVLGMALTWLGVGRVPISLILIVMMLTWGAAGFISNSLLRPATDWNAAAISLPVAAIIMLLVSKTIVMAMVRFVPLNESYAQKKREMVGSMGEALYPITQSFGMVGVRGERGDWRQVPCRVGEGVETIAKGSRVRLVAYSAADGMFYVAAVDAPRHSAAEAQS